MEEDTYSSVYDRIDSLNKKERELRAEIAEVRRERAKLKAQCHTTYITGRPDWIDKLPDQVWYPSYYANKVLTDLSPNLEQKNTPPDLIDWARTAGIKEFIVNAGVTLSVIIVGLQLIFLIF